MVAHAAQDPWWLRMRRRCRCRTLDGMTNPTRNGVDTAAFFATLDAVKGDDEIADFQFRATNRWVSGTHNRSTIDGFYGASRR